MKNLRLKAARAAMDMSQADLAKAVHVSRQTICAIEKGDYNPTIRLRRHLFRPSYSACSCDPSPFSSSRSPSSSVTTLSTDSPYRLWKVTSML